jgi:hypothetical protein
MPEIKITATTGSEIVTVSAAKDFIRIDTSDDDTLIGTMIEQARLWCENYISRDIVAKTRVYYLEEATKRFEVPFAPLASITSITAEGVAASYDTFGVYDEVILLDSLPAKDIKVTYTTAGMDDGLLQQAILQLVSTYYDNRADFIVMQGVSFVEVPTKVTQILNSYKLMFI